MERYKLVYQNNSLTKVIEITDENGVVRASPVLWEPSSPGWGALLSGIAACTASNLEVVQSCLYDDTTGDSLNLVPFVRYSTLDTLTGIVTYLGDYLFVSSGVIPYSVIGTPLLQAGDSVIGSQCFRTILNQSGTWLLSAYPQTYSITFNAISGTPAITDEDGTTDMFQGETVTYTATNDGAGLLTGTLQISATTGDVVVISRTELAT